MRKGIAWLANLTNIGILAILILKHTAPFYGAIACGVATLTILVAVIPEALTPGEVYNDEM